MEKKIAPPIYSVTYNGTNITVDVSKYLITLKYEDTVEGESDSLELVLENEDGLWSNGWCPTKGDTLSATIGSLNCGEFEIDEIEFTGPPDTITIRSLSNIPVTGMLKTKRSRAHENKSLHQIAQTVAKANGLTVQGNVPNIIIDRVTQKREHDLKFLRRISWKFGLIFNVRGDKLIFMSLKDLDNRPPSIQFDKTDLISYSIKDKTSCVYKDAEVKYHNPTSGTLVKYKTSASQVITVKNDDNFTYNQVTSGNTLVVHKRAENKGQAEAIGQAELYRANGEQQSGNVSTSGNEFVVAGNNMALTGLGLVGSGIYNIRKSTHTVDRDNEWVTDAEIKRTQAASKTAQRGRKVVKANKPDPGQSKIQTLKNKDNISYPVIR